MPDQGSAGAKLSRWVNSHKAVAYGGAGVLAVGGVIYFRRRAARQAAAAGTTGQIDPQTGLPAGSPEDQAALQQQGFYGTDFPGGGTGFNPFPVGGGGGSEPPETEPPPPKPKGGITTNEEWVQAAERDLPNGHSSAVETALVKVLGGQTVTQEQRAIFLEAEGVLGGGPPQGFPKPIKVSHGPQDGGGSHPTVKVPSVIGMHVTAARLDLARHGLKEHSDTKGNFTVHTQRPEPGAMVRRGSTVTLSGTVVR